MAKDRSEEVRAVMVESARVQVASMNAGIAFWRGWVERAAEYAENASRELTHVTDRNVDSGEMVGRLTDSTRTYLRRLAELPELTAATFYDELQAATPVAKGKRKRAARVKG